MNDPHPPAAFPAAPQPVPSVTAVAPYKGGDSALPGFADPIKLASNENPLGVSPAARAAVAEAAARLNRYPDPAAVSLREALGRLHGVDPDRIVCSAGSDEITQMIVRAFIAPGDEIIQSRYGFSIYRVFAQVAGAVVRLAEETNLTADVDAILSLVGPRTRVVFLANPNNPTGTYISAAEVRRLHAGLPSDVLLVLDGAYAEYVEADDYSAGVELATEAGNVLVVRTFSKAYGLAALRLGWAYGSPALIQTFNTVREPFNVSALAQAAGVAALGDQDFIAASVAHNRKERARLSRGLADLGLEVVPTAGNFVLAGFPDRPGATAPEADAWLRAAGIIVRRVDSYGLDNYLRISVGTASECDAVLGALSGFLDHRGAGA